MNLCLLHKAKKVKLSAGVKISYVYAALVESFLYQLLYVAFKTWLCRSRLLLQGNSSYFSPHPDISNIKQCWRFVTHVLYVGVWMYSLYRGSRNNFSFQRGLNNNFRAKMNICYWQTCSLLLLCAVVWKRSDILGSKLNTLNTSLKLFLQYLFTFDWFVFVTLFIVFCYSCKLADDLGSCFDPVQPSLVPFLFSQS